MQRNQRPLTRNEQTIHACLFETYLRTFAAHKFYERLLTQETTSENQYCGTTRQSSICCVCLFLRKIFLPNSIHHDNMPRLTTPSDHFTIFPQNKYVLNEEIWMYARTSSPNTLASCLQECKLWVAQHYVSARKFCKAHVCNSCKTTGMDLCNIDTLVHLPCHKMFYGMYVLTKQVSEDPSELKQIFTSLSLRTV